MRKTLPLPGITGKMTVEGATSLLTTLLPNPNPSAFPQDLANIPDLGYARAGQKGAGGRAGL